MRLLFTLLILVMSWPLAAEDHPPQDGYSFAPLEDPIFDKTELVVEFVAFNNWLNSNYSSLSAETLKGPREHLYYILCSYVSELYKTEKVVIPKEHDALLQQMFFWSESLGVYGGSLVYNQLKNSDDEPMPEVMEVPGIFNLALEHDLFILGSSYNGWSVKFPYYFMIGDMQEFTTPNDMRTQVVTISTGAARDNTEAGHSQATLLLIVSLNGEFEVFSKFWHDRLGIPTEIESTSLPVKGFNSRATYDEASLLHKELTAWPTGFGSFAVAYLGMDGTYQVNRQHFLDFLAQIDLGQEAGAN